MNEITLQLTRALREAVWILRQEAKDRLRDGRRHKADLLDRKADDCLEAIENARTAAQQLADDIRMDEEDARPTPKPVKVPDSPFVETLKSIAAANHSSLHSALESLESPARTRDPDEERHDAQDVLAEIKRDEENPDVGSDEVPWAMERFRDKEPER